jgi:serine/threonine protein kinase
MVCAEYSRALLATRAGLGENWRTVHFCDGPLTWVQFDFERGSPPPDQGWKVHIASSVGDSPRLFARVVPFVLANECSFKIPASVKDIIRINLGQAGSALIGKVVTIYPANDDEVRKLVAGLSQLWQSDQAPQIWTDLQVRTGGSIYVRFGGFQPGAIVEDAFGVCHPAVRRPDGALVPDERRLDGVQPYWAVSPIHDAAPVRGRTKRELTVRGRRYLLLGTLQSTPKGETFLAADEDLLTYVVKVARQGVAEDATGRDARARLKREAQFLNFLHTKGFRSPRVHAIADDAIVLQDIEGVPLNELPREELCQAFSGFVSTVADLHRLAVMHGDLKLSNAILAEKDIYLLDFELSAFAGVTDGPNGGTKGYMSPERLDAPASPANDVFSLGASLAHAALQVDPGSLIPGAGRLQALLICTGQGSIAKIVAAAMNANPKMRPTACELSKRLTKLPAGWPISLDVKEPPLAHAKKQRQRRKRKIIETALYCGTFATDLSATATTSNRRGVAGMLGDAISSGIAGIILGLAAIDFASNRSNFDSAILTAAERLARDVRDGPALGLFTGQAGIALVLALVANKYSRTDLLANAQQRFMLAADRVVELDLFSGAAGILWGACALASVLKAEWPLESAEQVARNLREGVREHDRLLVWALSANAVNDAYLGAAHGSAGIAMSLGIWGRETGCARSLELSRETFLGLYENGRTPDQLQLRYQLNSESGTSSGSWCHGAAGYLWSMLQTFGDHLSLRDPIDWAFRAFTEVPLIGNASYCHGMAGQLDLWNMLVRHQRFSRIASQRASLAARLLEHLGFRLNNSWAWPSNESGQIRCDLWTGTLGPTCALALFEKGNPDSLFCPDTLARVFQSRANLARMSFGGRTSRQFATPSARRGKGSLPPHC